MQDYYSYVKQVTAIHNEAVRRLVDCEDTNVLELAALFEDAANHYLDISEKIRARHTSNQAHALSWLVPQLTAPSSATAISREATGD